KTSRNRTSIQPSTLRKPPLPDPYLLGTFCRPGIADAGLNKLDRLLGYLEEGIAIVDCLYSAIPKADFTRLNSVGGILSDITTCCRQNNVTPLYIHHTKAGRVSGLASLSGCGLAEHCGQWLLLDRIGRYDHETGGSRYRLEIGSRAGFGGRYTLQVTEGRLSDSGVRCWQTVVTPFTAKGPGAPEDGSADRSGDDTKLVDAVLEATTDKPVTKGALRKATKRSGGAVAQAVDQLLRAEKIVAVEVRVRGNTTTAYRLPTVDERRTSPPSNPG
ncbi:MAG: hypothetical protein ACYC3X_31255, partial [Pirellulaceae bacterium]